MYLKNISLALGIIFFYIIAAAGSDSARIIEENKSPTVQNPLKNALGEEAYNEAMSSGEYKYVGNDKCRLCHRDFFVGRKQDHHDHAMDYIKESAYADNPKCLACHATGYGVKTGFVSIAQTPRLANVQCEGCHGPGSVHLKTASMKKTGGGFLAGTDSPERLKKMCKSCHTARWDRSYNDFESAYAKYKKAVPK